MKRKRIWITGICSLIGSHLANALIKRGDIVGGNDSFVCDTRHNMPKGLKRFTSIACQDSPGPICRKSLAEELLEFKPDVVVHCAATAAEGFSVFSPHFITKNIAEASVATFSAAIACGAKRIVHFSSMSRYGKGKPPFREDDPVAPVDSYALAKVYSEQQLKILCGVHKVAWTIACPHNVIGPGQEITPYRNVVTIFLNALKQGKPIYIYGDGQQKRCFSPVADCIPSIVKMVDGHADNHVVNIGPDTGEITINQLVNACATVLDCQPEIIHIPGRPLTDDVKEAYCASDKARKFLGFKPQQSFIDCLREMADALHPKPFRYNFPLEIKTENTPRTWAERLY